MPDWYYPLAMRESVVSRSRALCRFAGVVGGLALLLGCRADSTSRPAPEPLFDAASKPLVLTESREFLPPPVLAGNRFVRGWTPVRPERGQRALMVIDEAVLEGVRIGAARPGRLVLRGDYDAGDTGVDVLDVRFEDGNWESVPARPRISLRLPNDLPLGRFSVSFRVARGTSYRLRRAGLTAAAPAGEVRLDGRSLDQAGTSLVETVRRLDGPTELTGRFRPPRSALPGQQFSLLIDEEEDGEREVVSWAAGEDSGEERAFSVALRGASGYARIRFVARGQGPPARWHDLSVGQARASVSHARETASPASPRIVLLYIMDALRADYVGHLGGPRGITPFLDRLAAEGTTFGNHFSIAPNTVPSMKSLLTGRVFLATGGHKLDRSLPTLAQAFSEAGFATALFSGNGNVSSWRGMTRGFDHVARSVLFATAEKQGTATYNDNAERVHAAAWRWIEAQDRSRPLFLHLQTVHPHNPYDPPPQFEKRFAAGTESTIDGSTETLTRIRQGGAVLSEADKERLAGLYAAGVAYNDAELGRFMARVLERYPPEEVLVIVTSDHGEELFDHGGVLHGYTLYEEQLRIPLVVWWPGTVITGTVEQHTSTLDLHASLRRLALPEDGAEAGGRQLWPALVGSSAAALDDEPVVYAAASSVPGGIFMARSEGLKVIWAPRTKLDWGMGVGGGRSRDPEYVFDLVRDPGELQNRAGARSLEADWLRGRMLAWIEAGKRLESGEPVEEMDEETRQSLRALGYLE